MINVNLTIAQIQGNVNFKSQIKQQIMTGTKFLGPWVN